MSEGEWIRLKLFQLVPITSGNTHGTCMKNRGPVLTAKTHLQRRLMWLILASMAVPSFLLGGAVLVQGPLDFLAGNISEDGRDELMLGLTVLTPVLLSGVIVWAYIQTNRLVGPVERMIKVLDARIDGTGSGSIVLRNKDVLAPLADRINVILTQWESLKKKDGASHAKRADLVGANLDAGA